MRDDGGDPTEGETLDVVLEGETETPADATAPARAHLIARTCPYCLSPFAEGTSAVICPVCETPHHADCWQENGGCTTYGCTQAPGPHKSPVSREPAVEVRLSGPSIELSGRGWGRRIRTAWGRRPEDIEGAVSGATALALIGAFAIVHPVLCPFLVSSILGILRARRALVLMRGIGDAAKENARLAHCIIYGSYLVIAYTVVNCGLALGIWWQYQ